MTTKRHRRKTARELPPQGTTFTGRFKGQSYSANTDYNGDGLRVQKKARPVQEQVQVTDYLWDVAAGLPVVLQETTNGATDSYVYGLDLVSATDNVGVQSYFLQDGLGSTTGLTDGDGDVTASYEYDVFGAVRAKTGDADSDWRFTGEHQDSQVARSLYYLRARYYDPAIGRFLSRDPWPANSSDPQSWNRYVYVYNNPMLYIDPWGYGPLDRIGSCLGDPKDCAGDAAEGVGEGVDKASDIAYDLMPRNAQFFFDFATGTGKGDRYYYGPDSAEVRGMRGSAGAQKIRDAFVANGCKTTGRINYQTGEAFWDTVLHPLSPAFQVAGFAGASATRVASDSKEGNDMLRIQIYNEAGTESFFYHLVPNSPFSRGPGRTIYQTFDWEEPLPAACQK